MKIASHPENTIGANNIYDVEYMKYFTGLKHVDYIPSACYYVTATYQPIKNSFLIAPSRGVNMDLAEQFKQYTRQYDIDTYLIHDLYDHFEYHDLASHKGIIIFPYQISFMLFFELYSMNIPLYIPTPSLLIELHIKYNILTERTWNTVLTQMKSYKSNIIRHPYSYSKLYSDPNDDYNVTAILEWIQLSDFYQFPHIIQFNTFEEFILLQRNSSIIELHNDISNKMKLYNNEHRKHYINNKWSDIINKIRNFKNNKIKSNIRSESNGNSQLLPLNINEALRREYDIALSNECFGNE
jgi:hypothetical protein